MKKIVITMMLLGGIGICQPLLAAEPSLHEVYQAANSGKLDEAQHMMKEVLQSHPNSGKAHYVEAELLAKQGHQKQAAAELATAEKLAPGLPFATTQSVSSLREALSRGVANSTQFTPAHIQSSGMPSQVVYKTSDFPWGLLILGLGVIAFIVWATKFMASRQGANVSGQSGFEGYRPAYPNTPYGGGQAYGAAPSTSPVAGPGLGSQMLGGLATGAAVGAGVVAGEALMHHFLDGNKSTSTNTQTFAGSNDIPELPSTPLNELGGNDFGISDSDSWDDGRSGDSDWT